MFTPLDIRNTSNCLPLPWHPSVVYIKGGWNGHSYWMAQTPYPPTEMAPYRDRYELPCVHYSDDGIHWLPINANPIVDLTADELEAHNYYSDPHLIVVDDHLELFFRFTMLKDRQLEGNKTLLLRSVSNDGFTWSEPLVIADLRKEEELAIWGEQVISQAICWGGKQYRCWYVDKSSYMQDRNIRMTISTDGKKWKANQQCVLDGVAIDPWHIDVQYYDNMYQMIVYDMDKLVWYESDDGIHFQYVSEILSPSPYRYDFYADGLYRACSVKTDDGIRIYFSARRKYKTYLGLLSTKDRKQFVPVNGISKCQWLPVVWKSYIKSFFRKM